MQKFHCSQNFFQSIIQEFDNQFSDKECLPRSNYLRLYTLLEYIEDERISNNVCNLTVFFNFNVFVSCTDFSNSLSRLLVWSMYILDQKLKVTFSETDYFNHISPTSSFRSFKIFVHDLGETVPIIFVLKLVLKWQYFQK